MSATSMRERIRAADWGMARALLKGEVVRDELGLDPSPALREVHARRLLHLDVKPANIYLRDDGPAMLLDFGAARRTLTDDAPELFPMYTPGFAAPEPSLPNRYRPASASSARSTAPTPPPPGWPTTCPPCPAS